MFLLAVVIGTAAASVKSMVASFEETTTQTPDVSGDVSGDSVAALVAYFDDMANSTSTTAEPSGRKWSASVAKPSDEMGAEWVDNTVEDVKLNESLSEELTETTTELESESTETPTTTTTTTTTTTEETTNTEEPTSSTTSTTEETTSSTTTTTPETSVPTTTGLPLCCASRPGTPVARRSIRCVRLAFCMHIVDAAGTQVVVYH